MKVGGKELGWVGKEFKWVMSCDVKDMVAVSAPVQAICPVIGEEFAELACDDWVRERSLGRGWERGTQLRVYMVRRGIS
jgi:hypothetical protein